MNWTIFVERAVDPGEEGLKQRPDRLAFEIGREIGRAIGVIGEREFFGGLFDKEVERVPDGEIGGEVDLDFELGRLSGEDEAGQPIAVRVLLPVDEMVFRQDFKRIARNPRAAMRRRPQPDNLRADRHRVIVAVVGDMVQGRKDRHNFSGIGEAETKATGMPSGKPR